MVDYEKEVTQEFHMYPILTFVSLCIQLLSATNYKDKRWGIYGTLVSLVFHNLTSYTSVHFVEMIFLLTLGTHVRELL